MIFFLGFLLYIDDDEKGATERLRLRLRLRLSFIDFCLVGFVYGGGFSVYRIDWVAKVIEEDEGDG